MKSHLVLTILCLLASILIPLISVQAREGDVVAARAPRYIAYRGTLTDPSGARMTGEYRMTFSVYESRGGTTPVWEEIHSVTATDGDFEVILGKKSPVPASTEHTYFLGIRIDGEDLMPRQRVEFGEHDEDVLALSPPFYSSTPGAVGPPEARPREGGGGWTDDGSVVRLTTEEDYVGIGTATPGEQLEITGNFRLPVTTAETGIIKMGSDRFIHTYGTNNFFAGVNAGNLTMTGGQNTAMGQAALWSVTSGHDNTAVGMSALMTNTAGNSNTALGSSSLANNTTASKNTGIGNGALFSQSFDNTGMTWDSDNTAVGYETLFSNEPNGVEVGISNTAIGSRALRSNTTGYENTAAGRGTLFSNTTGHRNTGSGAFALRANTEGYENTAIGFKALFSNTTGSWNTANGTNTLYFNTGGRWNTAIGYQSLYGNSTGDQNTACGENALYNNTTGSGNEAFGVASLYSNTSGNGNVAIGGGLMLNTVGNENTAVGSGAGNVITVGLWNTFVGSGANASAENVSNATAIGSGAIVDASNHVRIGDSGVTQIGGQVGWSNLSDCRRKEEVRNIRYGIDFITALKPVEFKLQKGNGRIDFGFIAQDIEDILGTDYNLLGIGADPDRMLSLRYTDLIAPMVKAIQEQQSLIQEQQKEIDELKTLVERLENSLIVSH